MNIMNNEKYRQSEDLTELENKVNAQLLKMGFVWS
jgi:hypothetical protein